MGLDLHLLASSQGSSHHLLGDRINRQRAPLCVGGDSVVCDKSDVGHLGKSWASAPQFFFSIKSFLQRDFDIGKKSTLPTFRNNVVWKPYSTSPSACRKAIKPQRQ